MNTARIRPVVELTQILHATRCRNCAHELDEGYAFCPGCGQKAKLHRLSFHDVVHEIVHVITHADAGIFALAKALVRRPGVVAREYALDGRRKRWFNPFTFLALTSAARVASGALFVTPMAVAKSAQHARAQALEQFIEHRMNLVIFAFVPFAAFVVWALFHRRNARIAEVLVAQVFFSGFTALVDAVLFPLGCLYQRYVEHLGSADVQLFGFVHMLVNLVYYACAYRQFFRLEGAFSYVKTFSATVLAGILWILVCGSLGAVYIRHGFG